MSFKAIKRVLILAFVIIVIYFFANFNFSSFSFFETKFPNLTAPKEVTYTWSYNGDDYKISKTLYGSVYDYYSDKPTSYTYYSDEIPDDWIRDYYSMFLNINEKDNSISDLLEDLKAKAANNNLDKDETVEFVLSFVQSIEYDSSLADKVLSDEEAVGAKYPYMVLYENSGTCSGKSFLAYKLLDELGYGVALFDYEADEHVTVAIKCDSNNSSYESGYCYAETTAKNPIGVIADFDENNIGGAFSYLDKNNDIQSGDVNIYLRTEGKSYSGVR
jgi:hypothetical protein